MFEERFNCLEQERSQRETLSLIHGSQQEQQQQASQSVILGLQEKLAMEQERVQEEVRTKQEAIDALKETQY